MLAIIKKANKMQKIKLNKLMCLLTDKKIQTQRV